MFPSGWRKITFTDLGSAGPVVTVVVALSREAGYTTGHPRICDGEREEREVTFFTKEGEQCWLCLTTNPSS